MVTLRLTVRRDGVPVTGAKVCLRADMPVHQHPGVLATADETGPGDYRARLTLGMEGSWHGTVSVGRSGGAPVVVPIDVEVE